MWAPAVIVLSVIAILYGALVSLPQPDMKRLIAYSSVSHMGFVTLGIFLLSHNGLDGAMIVMLAHGFNTGALFLLIGMLYERAHTREIAAFGGLALGLDRHALSMPSRLVCPEGRGGAAGFSSPEQPESAEFVRNSSGFPVTRLGHGFCSPGVHGPHLDYRRR